MLDRLYFLPVAVVLGFTASYLDFGYLGFGVLTGIAILLFSALRGESFAPAFDTGAILAFAGLACYLGSHYVAWKHGISLDELATARGLPRYLRRLPLYGITAITMGAVLIILDIANRRDGE